MLIRCTHPAPCPAAVSPASDVRDRAMITERECAACKALLHRKYGIPKRAAAIAPVFAGRDAIGCASGGKDGLPVPEPLKNALVQLHGRNDGD